VSDVRVVSGAPLISKYPWTAEIAAHGIFYHKSLLLAKRFPIFSLQGAFCVLSQEKNKGVSDIGPLALFYIFTLKGGDGIGATLRPNRP
jgi:hypothetical protein